MEHLKINVVLRTCQENMQLLVTELKSPRYEIFHI
jgi:hypothetical protein